MLLLDRSVLCPIAACDAPGYVRSTTLQQLVLSLDMNIGQVCSTAGSGLYMYVLLEPVLLLDLCVPRPPINMSVLQHTLHCIPLDVFVLIPFVNPSLTPL